MDKSPNLSPDSDYDNRSDEMILRIYASRKLRGDNLARLNAPKVVLAKEAQLLEQARRLVKARGLTDEQVKDALVRVASDEALIEATTKYYSVTLKFTVNAPYVGDLALEESKERLVPHLLDYVWETYQVDKGLAAGFIKEVEEEEE